MRKSLVFISHINAEKEIAIKFKELIEEHFLGLIDVFVSSDGKSIKMGKKWMSDISNALQGCVIEIMISSPISIQRPWINFEAGAGWVRNIPVIPLCHSGMTPSKLPIPLNLLQATKATDATGLQNIFSELANAIGAKTPEVDLGEFIGIVGKFERQYTFMKRCNEAFEEINALDSKIIPTLKSGQNMVVYLTELQISKLSPCVDFLKRENVLDFQRLGNSQMTTTGVYYDCRFSLMSKFKETMADPDFKF